MKQKTLTLTLCLFSTLCLPVCNAQVGTGNDVEQLKAKLAEQQKQIDSLRQSIADQQKLIENMTKQAVQTAPAANTTSPALTPAAPGFPRVGGTVASTTGALPATPEPAPKPALPQPAPATGSPLQIQLGNISITPVGFLDSAGVWRSKNAGSGIGSNFGSIPFDNSVPGGKLNEFRFSPQNSRLGFRIDGNYKGIKFLVYNEDDFLGNSANNIGITNGAFVPRMRLFWVDTRKGGWDFLTGQSWSMLTPNRKGISPLPGDIFYSQVFDVNYVIGIPWTRQMSYRLLYHGAKEKWTVGISAENPNQYMGGYGGAAQITLPSALSAIGGTQLDNGSASALSTPNLRPDIIAKIALDPSPKVHFEIAGVSRTFRVYNTSTGQPTSGQTFTKSGGGGTLNGNFEVAKGFRLITNNAWGDGLGRYIFGNAPDVVVRADGSLSPIHTYSTVDGAELTYHKTLLYFYYGGIFIGKNVAVDANGTSLVGWGYNGSSNGQNRSVEEYTFGFNQTMWKDAKWGAINLMGQYEYATRTPWYVATGALNHASDHTVYFDVRYTLPGAPPPAK
jgi:hypothetical protein